MVTVAARTAVFVSVVAVTDARAIAASESTAALNASVTRIAVLFVAVEVAVTIAEALTAAAAAKFAAAEAFANAVSFGAAEAAFAATTALFANTAASFAAFKFALAEPPAATLIALLAIFAANVESIAAVKGLNVDLVTGLNIVVMLATKTPIRLLESVEAPT